MFVVNLDFYFCNGVSCVLARLGFLFFCCWMSAPVPEINPFMHIFIYWLTFRPICCAGLMVILSTWSYVNSGASPRGGLGRTCPLRFCRRMFLRSTQFRSHLVSLRKGVQSVDSPVCKILTIRRIFWLRWASENWKVFSLRGRRPRNRRLCPPHIYWPGYASVLTIRWPSNSFMQCSMIVVGKFVSFPKSFIGIKDFFHSNI